MPTNMLRSFNFTTERIFDIRDDVYWRHHNWRHFFECVYRRDCDQFISRLLRQFSGGGHIWRHNSSTGVQVFTRQYAYVTVRHVRCRRPTVVRGTYITVWYRHSRGTLWAVRAAVNHCLTGLILLSTKPPSIAHMGPVIKRGQPPLTSGQPPPFTHVIYLRCTPLQPPLSSRRSAGLTVQPLTVHSCIYRVYRSSYPCHVIRCVMRWRHGRITWSHDWRVTLWTAADNVDGSGAGYVVNK